MADGQGNERREVSVNLAGAPVTNQSWADALRELEAAEAPEGAAAGSRGDASAKTPMAQAQKPMAQTQTPVAQTFPDTPDGLAAATRQKIADTVAAIEAFVTAHPYLIAPNVYRHWEDNLREISVTMERQLTNRDNKSAAAVEQAGGDA
ncbi:hypothetical protein BH09SUM1_BH09SUM1_29610 [soil metagenome]